MNSVEIFEKFIKHHTPIFTKNRDYIEFCNSFGCSGCKAVKICDNLTITIPGLTPEEFSSIQEKYPEVFI